MPSSRHSSDTDVSRCAIADWASLTWAFVSAKPFRPRARAASSPVTVRSRIRSRSNSASAAKMAEHEAAGRGRGVDLRALAGQHPQAHAAG